MNADRNENAAGRAQPVKRGPHTIRFSAPEWDRIEEFSGARGLSPAAFVRYAALAAIEAPQDTLPGRLAPLIERSGASPDARLATAVRNGTCSTATIKMRTQRQSG